MMRTMYTCISNTTSYATSSAHREREQAELRVTLSAFVRVDYGRVRKGTVRSQKRGEDRFPYDDTGSVSGIEKAPRHDFRMIWTKDVGAHSRYVAATLIVSLLCRCRTKEGCSTMMQMRCPKRGGGSSTLLQYGMFPKHCIERLVYKTIPLLPSIPFPP